MKRVLSLLALCALAGCYSENTDTSPTLGTVGNAPEPTATTLLPEVFNTESDLTVTAPPYALFGGDLCTALVAKDFLNIRMAGLAPGALINSGALSPDSCGYTVHSGRTDLEVLVEARTAQEFTQPATTPDVIAGLGLGAIGFEKADGTYLVLVKVANGYFSVTTPDPASAVKLAMIALGRSGG
ncbi:MAG: hypothetical protein F2681_00795 [Actinobacteria bacterium]|jgi:hypothetical protein|nr:hypothetical protein [Actinomycetota bacterium]MSW77731.1 hypothetical protein [Actinomycetota bacterium]MSX55455.1 hypothetical protein [Actinomycetota bacterium]MSX92902.1 hypothetical protein [Actinomycetota bacterium]MSZ81660.1 hypothetical protein [Actinomycetota bacterium]